MRLLTLALTVTLVACNTGRPPNPIHRVVTPNKPERPVKPAANATAKTPAAPTKTPAPKDTPPAATAPAMDEADTSELLDEDSAATVSGQAWCTLTADAKDKGDNFLITRFMFNETPRKQVYVDQLVIPKDQAPQHGQFTNSDVWHFAEDKTGTRGLSVEFVPAKAASALPELEAQTLKLERLNKVNLNVAASQVTLAEFGALKVKGRQSFTLFPCFAYSADFDVAAPDLTTEDGEEAAPKAKDAPASKEAKDAKAPAEAPVAFRAGDLKAPLAAGPAEAAVGGNKRWCAFTPQGEDAQIDLIQFDENNHVLFSRFKRSEIQDDLFDRDSVKLGSLAWPRTKSRVAAFEGETVTLTGGRQFRVIDDANGARVLVEDGLKGPAAPAAGQPVYWQCLDSHIPASTKIRRLTIKKNLNRFMDLSAQWQKP